MLFRLAHNRRRPARGEIGSDMTKFLNRFLGRCFTPEGSRTLNRWGWLFLCACLVLNLYVNNWTIHLILWASR
jgi:hypothetical protein